VVTLMIIPLVIYGVGLWVLWMFYRALARIGEELGEIRGILQQRTPPPPPPEGSGDR